jgi:hypothetical protein
MKRILSIFLVFSILLIFCSCNENYTPKEQPTSYSEDIQVVVTKISKKQWFAGTAQREVEISVYSDEYNISGKDTIRYTGMFGSFKLWDVEKGDTVTARMIIVYMKSTGEITKRYIDKVYS